MRIVRFIANASLALLLALFIGATGIQSTTQTVQSHPTSSLSIPRDHATSSQVTTLESEDEHEIERVATRQCGVIAFTSGPHRHGKSWWQWCFKRGKHSHVYTWLC